MKHLIVCSEYPPAPSGGIGTYTYHLAHQLAKRSETIHVIGPRWRGAEEPIEVSVGGKLIVHRVPYKEWGRVVPGRDRPLVDGEPELARALFGSEQPTQYFTWGASRLAERLVEDEKIDVIEVQDYEAPLYFFQLRRALGLGPKERPPCFVHLHSPTALIARFDDWDEGSPSVVGARRSEEFALGAADAFLCPSRYLTRQVEARYGIEQGRIRVIPYPLGETSAVARDRATWDRGSICYVGRLERRKGVLEWISAAVAAAGEDPAIRFEFIGKNVLGADRWSGDEILRTLIPREMRKRFVFRGPMPRSELGRFLSRARVAVVPSRWENFPYTCVEAMASGLPVIASPEGGMKEMIEDGASGWIAESSSPEDLLAALRRALAVPPSDLARMGARAAAAIRTLCDNDRVIDQQLDFRREIAARGAVRSERLPDNLPRSQTPLRTAVRGAKLAREAQGRLSVVIACGGGDRFLDLTLASLQSQTEKPLAVSIVDDGGPRGVGDDKHIRTSLPGASRSEKKNAGVAALDAAGVRCLGLIFLGPGDRLHPSFLSTCRQVLEERPEVGLVSSWVAYDWESGGMEVRPCPSFPYQWIANEAASFSAVRHEAFLEAGPFDRSLDSGYEDWDLFNAVLANGWVGVTIPAVLGETSRRLQPGVSAADGTSAMRTKLLARFPELLGRDAGELVLLLESGRRTRSASYPKLRHRILSMVSWPRSGMPGRDG